jgi:hypothetical protein
MLMYEVSICLTCSSYIRVSYAGQVAVFGGPVGLPAVLDLVVATLGHVISLLHEGVDSVINCLDAVGVVHGELGIVGSLDLFVDDTIDYAERVHLDLDASAGAVLDLLVLLVEIVVESGAVVTAVTVRFVRCIYHENAHVLTSR